jgi:MFS family permease
MQDHSTRQRTARRALQRIVAMEVVSGLGDGLFWVALIALLVDDGAGAAGFAAAALVRLGPRALLSAPAGAVADRIDRRSLLVGLDVGRAALMTAIALGAARSWEVSGVLGLVFVAYLLAAPYRPALTAALPLVVGESRLSPANAAIGTTRQVMTFIGPLVGAAVVVWWSIEVAILANAVSFVVSAVLVAGIPALSGRAPVPVGMPAPIATLTGYAQRRWLATRRTPGLGVLVGLVFVMYAVRGAELVLYALVADERFDLGAAGVGLLTGAVGLGALFVMPLSARLAEHPRPDQMLVLSMAATAVPLMILATASVPALDVAVLVPLGGAVVVFEVITVVVLQRLAGRDVLGRVFGLVGSASNGGKLAGALLAPVLVALTGTSGALAVTAGVVAVAAALSWPALARLTRATRARRAELRPIVDHLATLGVFAGASRVALERVASELGAEDHTTDTVLIREGDPADDLFIAVEGTFSVHIGDRRVDDMHAGDWFGEIGLLQQQPRSATVTCTTPCTVWRIPGATFLGALADVSADPAELMDVMAERLRRRDAEGAS